MQGGSIPSITVSLTTGGEVGVVASKVGTRSIGTVSVELEAGRGGDKGGQGHFVLGECPSLVGANNSYTSQCLNGRKDANNGILLGHVRDSPCIGKGDNRRKSFRNHGNGTNQSNADGIKRSKSCLKKCDTKGDDGNNNDKDGNNHGDSVNLFKDGSLLCLDVVDKGIDGSNLGVVTCFHNNSDTTTLRD